MAECRLLFDMFTVVNRITSNLLREPTSWLLPVGAEAAEGLGRTFVGHTTSSASANRTPLVLLACTWMTL